MWFWLLNRRGSPGPAKRFLKFNWAATLTFDSIFYSGAITCFFYPSANWTLLLQERTDHLGAQPVEIHLYPNCFSSSLSFVLTAILNSQAGCRCTLVPRLPFPVPRSPFPVPGISNIHLRCRWLVMRPHLQKIYPMLIGCIGFFPTWKFVWGRFPFNKNHRFKVSEFLGVKETAFALLNMQIKWSSFLK
mgnify:CR=1 FL=1